MQHSTPRDNKKADSFVGVEVNIWEQMMPGQTDWCFSGYCGNKVLVVMRTNGGNKNKEWHAILSRQKEKIENGCIIFALIH